MSSQALLKELLAARDQLEQEVEIEAEVLLQMADEYVGLEMEIGTLHDERGKLKVRREQLEGELEALPGDYRRLVRGKQRLYASYKRVDKAWTREFLDYGASDVKRGIDSMHAARYRDWVLMCEQFDAALVMDLAETRKTVEAERTWKQNQVHELTNSIVENHELVKSTIAHAEKVLAAIGPHADEYIAHAMDLRMAKAKRPVEQQPEVKATPVQTRRDKSIPNPPKVAAVRPDLKPDDFTLEVVRYLRETPYQYTSIKPEGENAVRISNGPQTTVIRKRKGWQRETERTMAAWS